MARAVENLGNSIRTDDARIAESNLAQLLYKGYPTLGVERDCARAYAHLANVMDESQGKDVLFCCEFDDHDI